MTAATAMTATAIMPGANPAPAPTSAFALAQRKR